MSLLKEVNEHVNRLDHHVNRPERRCGFSDQELKASFDFLLEVKNKEQYESLLCSIGYYYEKDIVCGMDKQKAFDFHLLGSTTDKSTIGKAQSFSRLGALTISTCTNTKKDHQSCQCKTGFQYYQKAIELGSKTALLNVAKAYMNGWGVLKDEVKAFEYLARASKSGDTDAKLMLAFCYEHGIGTKKDIYQAMVIKETVDPNFHSQSFCMNHFPSFRKQMDDLVAENKKYYQYAAKQELEFHLLKDLCSIVGSFL